MSILNAFQKALQHDEIEEYNRQRIFRNKNTRTDYVQLLAVMKQELNDMFGITNLKEITEAQLKEYFVLLSEGRKELINGEEKVISPAKSHACYNKYISVARDYFYHHLRRKFPHPLDKNFQQKTTTPDKINFSDDARKKIIDIVEHEENAVLWKPIVGLLTFGLRENEVCFLYDKYINFVDRLIEITRTEHHTPKRYSADYERYVPVSNNVLTWIKEWQMEKQRITAEEPPFPINEQDTPLLFIDNRLKKQAGRGKNKTKMLKCKRWGKPLADYEVRRKFKEFLKKAGLSTTMKVHQLRSSYIMSLLNAGEKPHNIIISSGHHTIRGIDPYIRIADKKATAKTLTRNII